MLAMECSRYDRRVLRALLSQWECAYLFLVATCDVVFSGWRHAVTHDAANVILVCCKPVSLPALAFLPLLPRLARDLSSWRSSLLPC